MELDKVYQSERYEDEIYQSWEQGGFFNPDNLDLPVDAPSYTIILPPPNITDKLHLGHAAMLAIQDLFIRFYRMNTYRTLWLPGTDHAAIATQTAVEKKLKKEKGLTRHQLGREAFLAEVTDFVTATQATILNQTRKMGASLDWSRLAFTLDDQRQGAVKEMFCRMYEAGLLYRGERVINWCPRCSSTLADDEVEYKEQSAKLYTFRYSADCPIVISTTRPETKLGDTAIAVNPSDARYQQYLGQVFELNFCGQPLSLKVVADHHVEMEFGTGALGVTPAHSMVDWAMAESNNLPIVKVIDESGHIHPGFAKFSGLTVLEAREIIVAELRDQGLLIEESDISNNLSVCYRCDTPIEPLPSKQWFVAVDKPVAELQGQSLKEAALAVVNQGQIKFIPERFNKRYCDWMDNLKDWCVSRQLWYGHRLPVWYRLAEAQEPEIYVGRTAPEGEGWIQDGDSLDTWFSSGMWTFSTLGWPDNFKNNVKTGDLAKFHPTQFLDTGYEIITLWVSRMIMMSLFAVGEVPFKTVNLHGMILDKHGKKMSKSKGNGIDPLDMIKLYGTDAVRLSLLIGTTPGNDSRLSEDRIAVERNFVNKLWNISRYILENLKLLNHNSKLTIDKNNLMPADAWILAKLDVLIVAVTKSIKCYDYSTAGDLLKAFTWDDLADWYLEATKFQSGSETAKVLRLLLKNLLILWHPFMPYVTEVIWRELSEPQALIITPWPKSLNLELGTVTKFEITKSLITAIRTARSENKIEPVKKLTALIYAGDQVDSLKSQVLLLQKMKTGLTEIEIKTSGDRPADAIAVVVSGVEVYLLGAIDKEKERQRLGKEMERLTFQISSLESRLSNQDFVSKAPESLIVKQQEQLAEAKSALSKVESALASMS